MNLANDLKIFFERIQRITLEGNESVDVMVRHTAEELGEFSAAYAVERGEKKKIIQEHSSVEAIDLLACAASLYFSVGGTLEGLLEVGEKKLDKWESNLAHRVVPGATFNLSKDQVEKWATWQNEQIAKIPERGGAIGGRFIVEFGMTGLGPTQSVVDQITGERLSLTDFSGW